MSLFFKVLFVVFMAVVLLAAGAYTLLSASLPQITGQAHLSHLKENVTVERDALGVVTVRGNTRRDVALATGYVHAQDRFFQMDLLRRKAAGELAALIGPSAVELDVKNRMHGFRELAQQVVRSSKQADLIEAYTQGVNQGIQSLKQPPFEYLLLGETPVPWKAEDSVLVLYAMFLELQGNASKQDRLFGLLKKHLPEEVLAFLTPRGTSWDSPLDQSRVEPVSLPVNMHLHDLNVSIPSRLSEDRGNAQAVGSNNWAVTGALAEHGGALIAGDMHLPLAVPNIWYRLKLDWQAFSVSGVSLPGLPFVVMGSNEKIAWAFTNSYGDWVDLLDFDARSLEIEIRSQQIEVSGESPHQVDYRWTAWGPVLEEQSDDERVRVLRWVAHHPEAANFNLANLERASSVSEGVAIAQQSGIPAQNMLFVDAQGSIAWTIVGKIPQRLEGVDTRFPIKGDGKLSRELSWIAAEDYPARVNPEHGRLWSANGRMVGGRALNKLGDGGYALGARGKQIRDALFAKGAFSEQDFLNLQLDDRAVFLVRWQQLLLSVLTDEAVANDPQRREFKSLVQQWQGRAGVDSVAYRLVRGFRVFLAQRVFDRLLRTVHQAGADVDYLGFSQYEGPLWQVIEAQPQALIAGQYESWDALYLSVVDELIAYFDTEGIALHEATWGARNTLTMQHPLTIALPFLSGVLNMPAQALPGDMYMPRVQGGRFGASQRMVVSPGKEALGFMQMPGGQSGHPLSPFYQAGHIDWVEGSASSFLPGATKYTLHLLAEEVEQ